jgi:two-component system, NtrC family, sensor kinase
MKTVFIGGGAGCRDVLELYDRGGLSFLNLEILAVVDVVDDAPGMIFARERGWPTMGSIHDAMALPGLELVVEVTGDEDVLDDIYFLLPPGVRLLDHVLARVFWELDRTDQSLKEELRHKTRLEKLVADDRARLQEILDTLPDVVMVLDPDMRVVRVNRRFERVTGMAREEAYGQLCNEVFCKDDRLMKCPESGCPFMGVMQTKAPVTLVTQSAAGSHSRGWYQVTATPVFDDSGEIVRIVESSREITEQVMLKRETEESARRFRQILSAVHGAITIKDLKGRYVLVNPRAEHMFGLRQRDLLGLTAAEVLPADVANVIERHDREALDGGGHHVAEEEVRLRGKDRVLIAERFPMLDLTGALTGLCYVARDDTQQRQLQKEVLMNERLAAVGKLAAGVAHELNNPLTGILTFAEDLLLESDEGDTRREDYELIVNETMRCRRIVRDLLDFSRQKAPVREEADLNGVIRRTVNMVERQASFHDVKFELALADELPRIKIDPGQIQQAILNLVINARDAMNSVGGITIASGVGPTGRAVTISVADTGCGIDPEQQQEIFEPFYTSKGDQGNGLGLPAVLSIAQAHGGSVDVDSTLGDGTTFRLVFPAGGRGGGSR